MMHVAASREPDRGRRMTAWSVEELADIGGADELMIAPRRLNGTLQRLRIIWVVRLGARTLGPIRSTARPAPGSAVSPRAAPATSPAGGVDADVLFGDGSHVLDDGVELRVSEQVRVVFLRGPHHEPGRGGPRRSGSFPRRPTMQDFGSVVASRRPEHVSPGARPPCSGTRVDGIAWRIGVLEGRRATPLVAALLPSHGARPALEAVTDAQPASEGQRSTNPPERWAETTLPSESMMAFPWPLRCQDPGSPVMGFGKKGP